MTIQTTIIMMNCVSWLGLLLLLVYWLHGEKKKAHLYELWMHMD